MSISRPTNIQRAALPSLLETSGSRDAFIQSQTGSGKTLAFLLPILQDLLPLSTLSYIDRSIGTLAVIIAPTRELAKQISDVLELLLTLRLRPQTDVTDDPYPDMSSQRLTRWLVSGLLTGGATRAHEKARLRKGIPILVSTPGRLLDHLQNTASFNLGKCRWLVLDEADRLMDLGFEETIRGILKGLEGRRKLALLAEEEGKSTEVGGWDWKERRNILCSATIREDVQKLAGVTLKDPIVIKALEGTSDPSLKHPSSIMDSSKEKFTPPSQLTQKYVITPLKLRLVTLVALLRFLLTQDSERGRQGTKILVFFSCTDSVDFHWSLLGGATMDATEGESFSSSDSDENKATGNQKASRVPHTERTRVKSSILANTDIYRLHGSLPLEVRLASLKGFSSKPSALETGKSSILLCTSVASRGLDLPLVRAVIQHDLPTEGGADEYVHRVGRTARVGKGGEAWTIVGPSEEQWLPWVEDQMGKNEDKKKVKLQGVTTETLLKNGFGGHGKEHEIRATQVQLAFERWVLRSSKVSNIKKKTLMSSWSLMMIQHAELARKAYISHMRAYATHPSDEKHIFHIRHLHLGHLAKSFALREAPNAVTSKATKATPQKRRKDDKKLTTFHAESHRKGQRLDSREVEDAERRMTAIVRAQGRLSRRDGAMVTSGASEFQIASGDALESLVRI
jgi:ATP-dependent RNA helicase DDX31/DBP7